MKFRRILGIRHYDFKPILEMLYFNFKPILGMHFMCDVEFVLLNHEFFILLASRNLQNGAAELFIKVQKQNLGGSPGKTLAIFLGESIF